MTNKFICYICKDEWDKVISKLVDIFLPSPNPDEEDKVSLCDY